MQKDVVLRIPKCNNAEIAACTDLTSELRVMGEEDGFIVQTEEKLCSRAIPATCPRVQCSPEGDDKYGVCVLSGFIQSQENESGYWMKLPCSQCSGKTNLHTVTRGFVYGES